jgi:hypothetical protein
LGVIAEDNRLAAKGNTTNTENAVEWHWIWAAIILLIIIATFFVLFTFPIIDGDPWWQMAYGRYFIENKTLIPDHTIFSWSESDNSTIYCAWIAEIFLYLIYKLFHLPALFAFRYLCMAVFILSVFLYAKKVGMLKHPFTWLFCLIGILISANGAFIKPELFSYVFICLFVLNWFFIKSSNKNAIRFCYFFPIITLIWANSHGGFIFGMAFLCMVFVGEEINALFSVETALSLRTRQHLFISVCLSLLAVLCTPYGWNYPLNVLFNTFDIDTKLGSFIKAHQPSLSKSFRLFHYIDFLIIGIVSLAALLISKIKPKQIDWSIILTNILMIFLYIKWVRATYFWAPVLVLSVIYLVSSQPSFLNPTPKKMQFIIGAITICICLALGGRSVYERIYKSFGGLWFGYGISYIQPVEETDFIRRYLLDYRLGNDYNIGGYLLWKLAPDKKVFIDPRHFPFKKWAIEYHKFEKGINISEFLQKYQADVWCLHHFQTKLKKWFAQSKKWRLAFYGPSSAIYVLSTVDLSEDAPSYGLGINDIKNYYQAQQVLKFSVEIRDWKNAERILAGMKRRFRFNYQVNTIGAWEDLVDGLVAYHRRSYDEAIDLLKTTKKTGVVWSDSTLFNAFLQSAVDHWTKNDSQSAWQMVKSALDIQPNSAIVIYNIGVIEWYMENIEQSKPRAESYKEFLNKFLAGTKMNKIIPDISRQAATAILNGQYTKRPFLLRPKPPTKYEPEVVNLMDTQGVSLLPPGWTTSN